MAWILGNVRQSLLILLGVIVLRLFVNEEMFSFTNAKIFREKVPWYL